MDKFLSVTNHVLFERLASRGRENLDDRELFDSFRDFLTVVGRSACSHRFGVTVRYVQLRANDEAATRVSVCDSCGGTVGIQ